MLNTTDDERMERIPLPSHPIDLTMNGDVEELESSMELGSVRIKRIKLVCHDGEGIPDELVSLTCDDAKLNEGDGMNDNVNDLQNSSITCTRPDACKMDKPKKYTKKKYSVKHKKLDPHQLEKVRQDKLRSDQELELDALQELEASLRLVQISLDHNPHSSGMYNIILSISHIYSKLLEYACVDVFYQAIHFLLDDRLQPWANTKMALLSANSHHIDVFGQNLALYKPDAFSCDEGCGRMIASTRYAPHLEKCTQLCTRLDHHHSRSSSRRRSDRLHDNKDKHS